MPQNFTDTAEIESQKLGHVIAWDIVGDRMADGHCKKCGMTLTIAKSGGFVEIAGPAREQPCPRANEQRMNCRNDVPHLTPAGEEWAKSIERDFEVGWGERLHIVVVFSILGTLTGALGGSFHGRDIVRELALFHRRT